MLKVRLTIKNLLNMQNKVLSMIRFSIKCTAIFFQLINNSEEIPFKEPVINNKICFIDIIILNTYDHLYILFIWR